MKQLSDKARVPARTYYYLLDYIDRNKESDPLAFTGKISLHSLTLSEYMMLFENAVQADKVLMIKNANNGKQ